MFKKILKFLLIVLVWLLLAVLLIAGASFLGYPGEFGLYVFLALFFLWYGVKLGRKLYHRYRAKKRVRQLVNVEAPAEEGDAVERRFGLLRRPSELENGVRQLVRTLGQTELSTRGDPLYVLPWFTLLGNTTPDLATIIERTRLQGPTIDPDREDRETGVNWHLYNQGVLLSTPERFADGDVPSTDPQWLELLDVLVRYRSVEPLNGLVVAIPVTEILSDDTEALLDRALKLRRLIEDCVQVLGVQVPIYVLVTGLEELSGIDQWLGQLSDDGLRQAIGRINERDETPETLVVAAVESLARRVRQMNLEAVSEGELDPELMRLPVRVRDMTHSLGNFVTTLFQANPYQKTPEFRGLYFAATASRRGHAVSAFTRDLFTHILPTDRARVTPVAEHQRRTASRERSRMVLGAGVAGLLLAALGGLYLHDRDNLQDMLEAHQQLRPESDAADGQALDVPVRSLLHDQELINALDRRRWAPWLSAMGELEFTEIMKGRFVDRVHQELVQPIDSEFRARLEADFFSQPFTISDARMLDAVGTYIGILVRRINLLNAQLEGTGGSALRDRPMPYDVGEVPDGTGGMLNEINDLYVQSLIWREAGAESGSDREPSVIRGRRDQMVATLERILAHSNGSLEWVIDWVNDNPNYSGYRLSEFWDGGSRQIEGEVVVGGAFTLDGKDAIESFIEEMQLAVPDADTLQSAIPDLFDTYESRYLAAWKRFAAEFNNGMSRLSGRDEYLGYINNLDTGRNQYFSTLDLVYEQVVPFIEQGEDLGDWLLMLDYYNDMVSLQPDENADTSGRDKILTKLALKTVGTAGPLGKAIAKRGKKGMKTKRKLDKTGGGPSVSERMLRLEDAAALLEDYRGAIGDFVFNAEVRSVSFDNMGQRFTNPDNPGAGAGALGQAHGVMRELQALVGKPQAGNEAFWNLLLGPLTLIEEFALEEAACHFNDQYRNNFLASLESVPTYRQDRFAYGDGGALWRFIDEVASPFIRQEYGAGYVRVRAGDRVFPVTPVFLEYSTKAREQRQADDSFEVRLETRPTQTNLDALYQVEETRLSLQCPEQSSTLVNRNFPNANTFEWNELCGDTNLRLRVGGIELEKVYSGPNGFPNFLDEFRSGRKRFVPGDFPRHSEQLREFGVTYIDAQYDMQGNRELLRLYDTRPGDAPARAATCWSSGR